MCNRWARLFAGGRDDAAGQYQTQPLGERIACQRVGGFSIENCSPPSQAFRKSFENATVENVHIKGERAAAIFSNGETIVLVQVSDRGVWWVHKIGANAGKNFFE